MKYSLQDVMDDLDNCHDNDAWKKLRVLMKELREMLENAWISHDERYVIEEILGDATGRKKQEHKGPSEICYKEPKNYTSINSDSHSD